jgi:hypothetical protein
MAVLRRSIGLVAVALLLAACTSGGPEAKGTTTTPRVTTPTTTTVTTLPVLVDQARVAVLSGGPLPKAPSSWHRFSFAGLSFATPASWPRFTGSGYGPGFGCGLPDITFGAPTVTLSSDTELILPNNCAPTQVVLSAPSDGVEVDEIPSRAPFLATGLSTNCFQLHGLTACPYAQPAFGILYLLVTGPGLAKGGVMFEVGLAGSGAVARTIIGSLRSA